VHPDDLAGGFSDREMTWLLYCAGAATEYTQLFVRPRFDKSGFRTNNEVHVNISSLGVRIRSRHEI